MTVLNAFFMAQESTSFRKYFMNKAWSLRDKTHHTRSVTTITYRIEKVSHSAMRAQRQLRLETASFYLMDGVKRFFLKLMIYLILA